MNISKWMEKNTASLAGKTVAITGSTGGLGRELCSYLASLGASLILLDRSKERSGANAERIRAEYKSASVRCITLDLEDIHSVKAACDEMYKTGIDVFIHNAGAYSIPRHICQSGFDNVFQINFASPYFMIRELLPMMRERGGRVVVVGSIAHNYSHIDTKDIDFSERKAASKVYGNAKRFLMFSLYPLFRDGKGASLSVTHPGISFTGITNHYPKLIFAVIKHPMKVIFMKPGKAALSILRGVFESCGDCEWIGPSLFDVWGYPKKKRLRTVGARERADIERISESVYRICKMHADDMK